MLPASFRTHIATLAKQSGLQGSSAAMPGVVRRPWHIPIDTYPTGIDIQHPDGFTVACDRKDLNKACVDEYVAGDKPNSGRIGVVGALKTAIDYQAVYERALHARHASPVRLRVWASARRTGHQDLTHGVFGCVLQSLDSTITASRSVPNTQEAPLGDPYEYYEEEENGGEE